MWAHEDNPLLSGTKSIVVQLMTIKMALESFFVSLYNLKVKEQAVWACSKYTSSEVMAMLLIRSIGSIFFRA